MTSLEEAWEWFEAARRTVGVAERMARYWDDLPAAGPIGRDNQLRDVKADQLASDAGRAAEPLNDLAILVLFSVFETEVRTGVSATLAPHLGFVRDRHPVLADWAGRLEETVREGSFFHLLQALKLDYDKDLIEQVNQVRRYRNWVAHGRKGEEPHRVGPEEAYRRLRRLLVKLGFRLRPTEVEGDTHGPIG